MDNPTPAMKRPVFIILLVLLSTASLFAQDRRPALGINLEGYDYPYPAEYFTFESQQQSMEMAFMYEEAGDPNGRTILLFHGKNFNGAYFGEVMQALLDEGFNVLAPDQIGFGKSTKPDYYHYTFQQLAQNTKALADSLGISRTVVLGHSMGGMLATRFSLMYPGTVETLVLENPIGLEDWKKKVPYQGIDHWFRQELDKTYEGVKQYMSQSYYDNNWSPAYDEWLYLRTAFFGQPGYERYAWNQALTTDMVFTQPVLYEFSDLEVPAVLIIGQRDRTALGTGLVPDSVAATMGQYPKLGKRTAREIPDATLIELDGIGHLPHIEAFDRFMDALLSTIN
ncbi:Pimeloyl-ACP methyl ester carboxylesterase [Fodinibius roseus]|uniref:Pimeloyl-ACP methyl ester carboxylesterase n=1 Tax=Fodinibius roseus TaxID=1194090 RepID=A0A1M5AEF4_9BACT|nr:alpha/beta hydrolase [Fodinibius roseus]SHF28651.1 Pimeloyl-ACP methyl ester carboxylesterase [Fodinibius roseus]